MVCHSEQTMPIDEDLGFLAESCPSLNVHRPLGNSGVSTTVLASLESESKQL